MVPTYWTPAGDGEDYELTQHLQPLAEVKSEILLLENLWNAKTVGRNGHWPKVTDEDEKNANPVAVGGRP